MAEKLQKKATTKDVICLFIYPPIVLTKKKLIFCLYTTVRPVLLLAVLVLFSIHPQEIQEMTWNSLFSSILHTFYGILQFGGILN